MNEVHLPGMTREAEAMIEGDRSSDGVFSGTRAHGAEAELIRDSAEMAQPVWDGSQSDVKLDRFKLLVRAAEAPEVLGGWSVTPLDDRLLVRYASFREGYVCETCDGSGADVQDCTTCLGLKKIVLKDRFGNEKGTEPCPDCLVVGATGRELKPSGKMKCGVCKGSGLKRSGIAIPDESQQDHSYGDIISSGAQVYDLQVGDRVCFSKHAGIYLRKGENDKYGKPIAYCLLRRGEIMGYMEKR